MNNRKNFWQRLSLTGKISTLAVVLLVLVGAGLFTWAVITGKIKFFAAQQVIPQNLIRNGDFETGTMANWQTTKGTAYEVSSKIYNTNLLLLKPNSRVEQTYAETLEPLTKYELTAVYNEHVNPGVPLSHEGNLGIEHWESGQWKSFLQSSLQLSNEIALTPVIVELNNNQGTSAASQYRVVIESGANDLYVDNVALVSKGPTDYGKTQTVVASHLTETAAALTATAAAPWTLADFNKVGGTFENKAFWELKTSDTQYEAIVKYDIPSGNRLHVNLGWISSREAATQTRIDYALAGSHAIGGADSGIIAGKAYQMAAKMLPFNPLYAEEQQSKDPTKIVVDVQAFGDSGDLGTVKSSEVSFGVLGSAEQFLATPNFTLPTGTTTIRVRIRAVGIWQAMSGEAYLDDIKIGDAGTFPVTATPTPTITSTPTVTLTFTPTSTFTRTFTPTFTPTNTSTVTKTPTITLTFTPSPTATRTPTLTNSPSPTVTRTATLTPTLSPTATVTFTSTFSPTVTPTNTPGGPTGLRGDVNGDGVVSTADLQLAILLAGSCENYVGEEKNQCSRADLDGNGVVSRADLQELLSLLRP